MAVWSGSRGACVALAVWLSSGPALAGEHDVLALARLWSEVRAIHPALAGGTIDWDRALVAALPQLKGEDNPASLRAAAATLMAPLHDEALRIGPRQPPFVRWPADGDVLEWLPGDTALLHLHPGMRAGAAPFVLPARARRVILDLRPIAAVPSVSYVSPALLNGLLAQLIVQPLLPPAPRYRFSTGPRPQDPENWEGVLPGFMQVETQPLLPAPGARALPLAVIDPGRAQRGGPARGSRRGAGTGAAISAPGSRIDKMVQAASRTPGGYRAKKRVANAIMSA